jgi:hypothetical protein
LSPSTPPPQFNNSLPNPRTLIGSRKRNNVLLIRP